MIKALTRYCGPTITHKRKPFSQLPSKRISHGLSKKKVQIFTVLCNFLKFIKAPPPSSNNLDLHPFSHHQVRNLYLSQTSIKIKFTRKLRSQSATRIQERVVIFDTYINLMLCTNPTSIPENIQDTVRTYM